MQPNTVFLGNVTLADRTSDFNEYTQGLVVSNIIYHPKYDYKTHVNDIALVEYFGEAK